MTEGYIFTANQLKVLVKGSGYSRIVGLNLPSSPLDNQDIVEALGELMGSNMITSDGKRFLGTVISKKISVLLAASENYFAIHTYKDDIPDLCCFINNGSTDILVCSAENKQLYSLKFLCVDELFNNLSGEGYFCNKSEFFDIESKTLEEYEKNIFSGYNPNNPLSSDCAVPFAIERIDLNGKSVSYLRIIDYYFFSYILFFDGNKTERTELNNDTLKSYFKRLVTR